jgi:hypothetical protein
MLAAGPSEHPVHRSRTAVRGSHMNFRNDTSGQAVLVEEGSVHTDA